MAAAILSERTSGRRPRADPPAAAGLPWLAHTLARPRQLTRARVHVCVQPADHLFVVHLPRSDERREERWKVGGPLVPDLESALGHQRHSVTTLTGSLQSSIRDFVTQNKIDVVVMGERWPQHMFQVGEALRGGACAWRRGGSYEFCA